MLKALQRWVARKDRPAVAPAPAADAKAGEEAAAHYATGIAQRRLGAAHDALRSFQRAIELRADHADALTQQGELLAELGRNEDAADSFALALAFDASLAAAWLGYGRLMRLCSRTDLAIEHLQRAVTVAPKLYDAWVELALALNQGGRTDEAAAAYEEAIKVNPDEPGAYVNLGLLHLAQFGDGRRAESLFRQAVQIAPECVEAQANLGLALHEQRRSREAIEHYDRLLRSEPHCTEYVWHRASVRLASGDFEGGWEDHEARKQRVGRWRRPLPFREWDGAALNDEELLIYAEQGLGDEIMFASCVPDALTRARRCVVECDERLATLFQRSFPTAAVHGVNRAAENQSWLADYPHLTRQCATGSLPRLFRRSLGSFPDRSAYLLPDPERVRRWQCAIPALPGRVNVGIAWRGGTFKTRGALRSTELSAWAPVLTSGCARFFALQSAASDDLRSVRDPLGVPVHELGPVVSDIEELASIIAALDLVITVQGSVAHVAGALGKPVWILLNHSAEWRYLAAGERMPWYPSARLFRQPAPGAWDRVFARVAESLPAFCAQVERARPESA